MRQFSPDCSQLTHEYVGLAAAVLDPFLILLVDVCAAKWTTGDAFKLYNWFLNAVRFPRSFLNSKRVPPLVQEGSGVAGIFLTLLMELVLVTLGTFLLYMYLLYVHMNGRSVRSQST